MTAPAKDGSVLVVGDALFDYRYWIEELPPAGGDAAILSKDESPGGSAMNTALALAGLGLTVGFLGTVGDDRPGEALLARMSAAGVDTSLVRRSGQTGWTITMIDRNAERTMFSFRGASQESRPFTAGIAAVIERAAVLVLSGYLLTKSEQAAFALSCAGAAKRAGTPVFFDAAPVVGAVDRERLAAMLDATDILSLNRLELAALTLTPPLSRLADVEKILSCVAGNIPVIALKLDKDGSVTQVKKTGRFFAPAPEVRAVDTTGAGDAYNAGFLASFLRGDPPEAWGVAGARAAACVIGPGTTKV